jgi:hypothetical protein
MWSRNGNDLQGYLDIPATLPEVSPTFPIAPTIPPNLNNWNELEDFRNMLQQTCPRYARPSIQYFQLFIQLCKSVTSGNTPQSQANRDILGFWAESDTDIYYCARKLKWLLDRKQSSIAHDFQSLGFRKAPCPRVKLKEGLGMIPPDFRQWIRRQIAKPADQNDGTLSESDGPPWDFEGDSGFSGSDSSVLNLFSCCA